MFTEQVGMLEEAKTVDQLVDALRFLLGNCTAALRHNGQLQLVGGRAAGATDGVLEVSNGYINGSDGLTLPDSNGSLPNGWAAIFDGPVWFKGIQKGGGFLWAKATANWTNVAGDDSYVDCTLCTDRSGTLDTQGRTVRVYLPRNGTDFDPAVYSGGMVKFGLDQNGVAIGLDYSLSTILGEIKTIDDENAIPTGWHECDGSLGTVDLTGRVPYGWLSGDPTFGTAGAAIAAALTATISGSGTATSSGHTLTFGSTFTSTTGDPADTHDACFSSLTSTNPHTHTVSNSDIAGGLTIGTPSVNRTPGRVVVFIQRIL